MTKRPAAAKFNLVDLVIVVVVISLLAAGVYKLFFANQELQAQEQQVEYRVLLENVRKPTVDAFADGQKVREYQTNIDLGTVTGKESGPYTQPVPTLDGKVVNAPVPEKYNLTVTISSPAVISDNNVTINGKEIKTGDKITVKTNTASSTGTVMEVFPK
jgi:hypothetical protein